LLPHLVFPRFDRLRLDDAEKAAEAAAAVATQGLATNGSATLIEFIERETQPRALAGAVLAACPPDGGAPSSEVLATLAREYARSPERVERIADFAQAGPDTSHRTSPVTVLELALAVSGRSADLARLRSRRSLDPAD